MAIINGNAASNVLLGTAANDTIRGFDGNDVITGGFGADKMYGGNGKDTFVYTDWEQEGVYNEFADFLGPKDLIDGGAGFDTIKLTSSYLALENTNIKSIEGLTFGYNSNHNNTIGFNAKQLGAGQLATNLLVTGGNNNNQLLIHMADDTSFSGSSILFKNWQGSGNATRDNVNIVGDSSAETIVGTTMQDDIYGGKGNDRLWGGKGNDFVDGDQGADRLNGGRGSDTLLGGDGKDAFIFNTRLSSSSNVDSCDFVAGQDRFELDNAIFTALTGTTLAASAFKVIGGAAIDSNDRIIYDKAAGKLFYDADGSGDGSAQILFATVEANTVIKATDFLII